MQSSLIGKIDKANRYAREPERVSFSSFEASFAGGSDDHTVRYSEGQWDCTCNFFSTWRVCSHSMAMEKLLDNMVTIQSTEVLHAGTTADG